MKTVLYATGNNIKFLQAQKTCETYGIKLVQDSLDVPEVQSEEGEPVARDKAEKAFAKFARPIVISDDSWMIPGLKNFPGPYMKSINDWFTSADWLRLTQDLVDRRIFLQQIVVYQDDSVQKLFSVTKEGVLLKESRGQSPYAHAQIVSFDGGKRSDAEYHERNESAHAGYHTSWDDFAEWYKNKEG